MILCVEDDNSIRDLMIYTLNSAGFEAMGFIDGNGLFEALQTVKPQMIILDIMLPGEDGISILKRLRSQRETSDIPVIMATAKGTEYDKVIGLDLGADDYLAKPFGMMEMVSRIRAVLRRTDTKEESMILRVGGLELDPETYIVLVNGERIQLMLLGMAQPICIVFAIAVILSISLAVRISKRIVKPLNEINLDDPLSNDGYDELSPLLVRIDSQQKMLNRQKDKLRQKETELNTIIGSMNEGMVLLNQKGKIVTINPVAGRLLEAGTDCDGEDMLSLCRNVGLQEILSGALQGERGERTIFLQGENYQIAANPIMSDNRVGGAALFFFNVTEKEKAEQIRREFTANVSHELKTPLHSISGYAELLKNNMVKEEDRIPFAGKIYDEAQRMVQLVEDIISLSHLDEGAEDMQREKTDLYELAGKAVRSLEPEAEKGRVTVELSGGAAVLYGIPQLLYSIIYNLTDNAIKYNRENGKVAVDIRGTDEGVVLSVRDTGIGIAPEHRERIFERFYRVDKSHSKEVGGTGLGLSIVKHAAKIHDAKIEVESAVGKGTAIRVIFM